MRQGILELAHFTLINIRASIFGIFLVGLLFATQYISVPYVSRYDVIFISALVFQACALVFKFEKPREFFVIFLFHIVATIMEFFKTSAAIGSWTYPEVNSAFFAVATVPLFAGFLYSAVGSYISRAITFMHLSYQDFPRYIHVWIVSALIYLNFFTHHFIYDFRYVILIYIFIIFYKTKVYFTVYQSRRHIPFLLSALLTSIFIWIAENAGTFTKVWLYPSQSVVWHIVSFGKLGSWFLLLILSFALVSLVYRDRIYHAQD